MTRIRRVGSACVPLCAKDATEVVFSPAFDMESLRSTRKMQMPYTKMVITTDLQERRIVVRDDG
jgi:hypothetical protein